MKKSQELKTIREMDKKALYKELITLQKKLVDLQFQVSFRKLKNHQEIKDTRKKIARIWTVLQEKIVSESKVNS